MTRAFAIRNEAQADIREAAQWYEAQRAGLGTEFTRAVRALLASVEREPARFPVVHAEVRRALLRRFPYALYFIVEGEQTVLLACLHVRRSPAVWQSRR
ncbi:MAG: type II toxin-antitoxin system RelE/ParE family toxin [Myxococcaceae bacterium]|nr:type II toxin-antitoxin system RelE/ParE family toxin [Myxococcaceae bacterium]MCI0673923.1 type II toxin-antitoxin system RelE/ParE family toxin [Myxococcaceae bacterium]